MKALSSTKGHGLMNHHPFAQARYTQAHDHLKALIKALKRGCIEEFVEVVELEAMTLHALMMSSNPSVCLLKPETLAIIDYVKRERKKRGVGAVPVCFTLDAGPNLHLLYPLEKRELLDGFFQRLQREFRPLKVICDEQGSGPCLWTR